MRDSNHSSRFAISSGETLVLDVGDAEALRKAHTDSELFRAERLLRDRWNVLSTKDRTVLFALLAPEGS
jgi:hypothetical protein